VSGAIAEPDRRAGLRRLSAFAGSAGTRYAKSRNFDFGPGRRDNVSRLSPYLRHRLVLEQEVLDAALSRHDRGAAGKFVEEVFWRAYFKGWLEHRPRIWRDYREDVSEIVGQLESDSSLLERYSKATDGNTGIDCFDAWAEELVSTGYLHNHARMWFASIWVYTLDLPWQLGADFFFRHLVDADPASNTLSWRWVCGLHTRGKTYLARASNIARYTDNRFNPDGQLATSAPPLPDARDYPPQPVPSAQPLPRDLRFGLFVTEEDACPISLLNGRLPAAVLGAVATKQRSPLQVGFRAAEFASGAVADALQRTTHSLGLAGEMSGSDDWSDLLAEWARQHRLSVVVTAYAPVGPVAELLARAAERLNRLEIRLVQIRRPYDNAAWPHAQHGYFKLKQKIPEILDELAIPGQFPTHEH
jgi:deoxyribodipyrimidine photo-lyase